MSALDTILVGDARDTLRGLAEAIFHLVVTSIPYWALRKYAGLAASVWGGSPDCAHAWGAEQPKAGNVNRNGLGANSEFAGETRKREIGDAANASTGGQYCRLCGAWLGCWGNEPTLGQFVANTVEFFRAVRRVLRADGVLALNIGDSMSGTGSGKGTGNFSQKDNPDALTPGTKRDASLKPGDMCGVPWRVALALQADGWYLRRAVVWAKGLSFCESYSGSVMPESVGAVRWERCRVKVRRVRKTDNAQNAGRSRGDIPLGGGPVGDKPWNEYVDCPGCPKCSATGGLVLRRGRWRPTAAYEFIFILTNSEHYHANAEAVRESAIVGRLQHFRSAQYENDRAFDAGETRLPVEKRGDAEAGGTRNLRDAWWLPLPADPEAVWPAGDLLVMGPEPLAAAHYAAFPRRLPREFIDIFVPKKCCPKCGAGWAAVVAHRYENFANGNANAARKGAPMPAERAGMDVRCERRENILGHLPTCSHCQTCDELAKENQNAVQRPGGAASKREGVQGSEAADGPAVARARASVQEDGAGGVRELRGAVHGPEGDSLLQPDMLGNLDVEPGTRQSLHADRDGQVHADTPSGQRGDAAAQGDCGGSLGQAVGQGRSGASSERSKGRQQAVESGALDPFAAFSAAHEAATGHPFKPYPSVPGTVLDPCGGSGTTALAAQDAGVHWLLCEASAHYAETIAWPRIRHGSGRGKLPSKPKPAEDCPLFSARRLPCAADGAEANAPRGAEGGV